MIREFICEWFNCDSEYKKRYREAEARLLKCQAENEDLKEANRRLEYLISKPAPPPLDYIVERDSLWVQATLFKIGVPVIRVPLDRKYYLTNQKNFLNIVAWDWTDTYDYVKDKFDCENYALAFKSRVEEVFLINQVGVAVDFASGHTYNIVIFPDGNVMLLEPQTDAIFCYTDRDVKAYCLRWAIVLL